MNIKITVRNKLPICGNIAIVCNNSDYVIVWELGEEWAAYDMKTMRTTFPDGTYEDTVFTGTKVGLPVVTVPGKVRIGLYAGDIHTSGPACITAKPSILSCGGAPAAPSEDVYNQLMERMAQLETPDWAQNDESAKDYVKNRTHWVADDGTVHQIDEKYLPQATADDALVDLAEIITPAAYQDTIYLSPAGEIYTI